MANEKGLTVVEEVEMKVVKLQECNQLDLPKDYSAANALRGAWLVLKDTVTKDKKPVLEACTKESIALSLFKMVTEGLSVTKRQGAFIAYGNKLTFQREYAGTMALAKRFSDLEDVTANVIYKGDVFQYEIMENGKKRIVKHDQKIENIKAENIIGAYATAIRPSGNDVEIMTYDQIKAAWAMGGNLTQAHVKFPDQMCEKTVINRLLKPLINSSDDEALYSDEKPIPTQPVNEKPKQTIKPPEPVKPEPETEDSREIEEAVIVEEQNEPGF